MVESLKLLGDNSVVVDSLKLLVNNSVVHFDLKCANILLDPLVGVKDGELWNPLGHSSTAFPSPPFHAVLADFGEARSYRSKDEAFTARDRGTEVYKSPEMLLMNQNKLASVGEEGGDKGAASKAAVQVSGAGMASDVWSFGCLAYELLSGKVLFDGDYATESIGLISPFANHDGPDGGDDRHIVLQT
eukprot:gene8347-30947_t